MKARIKKQYRDKSLWKFDFSANNFQRISPEEKQRIKELRDLFEKEIMKATFIPKEKMNNGFEL